MALLSASYEYISRLMFEPGRGSNEAATDNAFEPFRFLDLPHEIRLMVYEELGHITCNHHVIPIPDRKNHITRALPDKKYYITLENVSISGVGILATCRLVNEEASLILGPKIDLLLDSWPTIIVQTDNLPALITLRSSFIPEYNIFDRIMQALGRDRIINAIHEHRTGHLSVEDLRNRLGLGNLIGKDNHDAVKAVASFILYADKCAEFGAEEGFQ